MGSDKQHVPEVRPFSIDFTVYYSVQLPDECFEEKPAVLLAVHGWGQNCRRFLRDFRPLRNRNVVVVAPQGPHQFYLDPGIKKVGFNWLSAYEKERSIRDVNRYFASLLEQVAEEVDYDRERVFLLGFSQGVSMASRFAVSGLVKPEGLLCCGADLAPDVAEKLGAVAPYRVYLAHGNEDEIIPRSKLEEAVEGYEAAGFDYVVDDYDGGHEITVDLVERMADWMEI